MYSSVYFLSSFATPKLHYGPQIEKHWGKPTKTAVPQEIVFHIISICD